MRNRWSEEKASQFLTKYGKRWGDDLALRTYTSRLIGAEEELVLHGGGNTSVKGTLTNILGECIPVIFVKASGHDLADIEPEGHLGLDLAYLKRLRILPELSDETMVEELRAHCLIARSGAPSIETLLHAFIPRKYVDHTHANSILALTNQPDGDRIVREALGSEVIVLGYCKPGFALAKDAAAAFEASPTSRGMVLMKHGLLTWGSSARECYEKTIELATRAEDYLARKARIQVRARVTTPPSTARERYLKIAPVLRGLLALRTANADWPYKRFILSPLITNEVLEFVDSDLAKEVALTPPLTSDHLIRTKPAAMWIENPRYDDIDAAKQQISDAIAEYASQYDAYFERHCQMMQTSIERFDPMPRVIFMTGLGTICAGKDAVEARVVRDITAQTVSVKAKIAAMGRYEGLSEKQLFDMEYFSLQRAKLGSGDEVPLQRSIALVTGAAGAIGSGICQELLREGCHVAVTDLPGDDLDSLADELRGAYGERVIAVPLDVTDPKSVAQGFDQVVLAWGGVDLVVANAGAAHVSSLTDMETDAFRRLERINLEGTLLIIREAARRFLVQGTGGDIVFISTKNVPAPGAKFGAYSATKAAAHQLARIASIELAEIDVRVNMVAPDGVFAHGKRRSGLWAEVGPDRMRARGLDEKSLEEYYQNRNLLKARITAAHVARAVLYFATRQTPTTGATLPVDGGLPEATPR